MLRVFTTDTIVLRTALHLLRWRSTFFPPVTVASRFCLFSWGNEQIGIWSEYSSRFIQLSVVADTLFHHYLLYICSCPVIKSYDYRRNH